MASVHRGKADIAITTAIASSAIWFIRSLPAGSLPSPCRPRQPDRGDRRAVVAGDCRPRAATPAGLTPRTAIGPLDSQGEPSGHRGAANGAMAPKYLSPDVHMGPAFLAAVSGE